MAKEICIVLEDALMDELQEACGGDAVASLQKFVQENIHSNRIRVAQAAAAASVHAPETSEVTVELETA